MSLTTTRIDTTLYPKSVLAKIQSSPLRVRCALRQFSTQGTVAVGTYDYALSSLKERTQDINGHLIPERYCMEYVGMPQLADIFCNCYEAAHTCQVTTTGAKNVVIKKRYFLDIPLAAKLSYGNFRFWTGGYTGTTVANGGNLFEIANTGTTGTISIQCNFGVLDTSGTLNQLSTNTCTLTLDGTAKRVPIECSDSTIGTTSDGDKIYIELIHTIDQTARSAGTNAIGWAYYTGKVKSQATNTYNRNTFLEFDIS